MHSEKTGKHILFSRLRFVCVPTCFNASLLQHLQGQLVRDGKLKQMIRKPSQFHIMSSFMTYNSHSVKPSPRGERLCSARSPARLQNHSFATCRSPFRPRWERQRKRATIGTWSLTIPSDPAVPLLAYWSPLMTMRMMKSRRRST